MIIVQCFSSSVSTIVSKYTISDSHKVKTFINNQDPNLEFSIEEVEQVKYMLLEIEKNFVGKEKINNQIKIFKKLGILPTDFSTDELFSVLDSYKPYKNSKSIFLHFGLTFGRLLVVSYLTIS